MRDKNGYLDTWLRTVRKMIGMNVMFIIFQQQKPRFFILFFSILQIMFSIQQLLCWCNYCSNKFTRSLFPRRIATRCNSSTKAERVLISIILFFGKSSNNPKTIGHALLLFLYFWYIRSKKKKHWVMVLYFKQYISDGTFKRKK